jgi:hypothetical protein
MNSAITTPGTGTSSGSPLKYLFFVSDGVADRVSGEFIIMLLLASGTDRGNGAAKRSDQGRHELAVVRQIFLLECCH